MTNNANVNNPNVIFFNVPSTIQIQNLVDFLHKMGGGSDKFSVKKAKMEFPNGLSDPNAIARIEFNAPRDAREIVERAARNALIFRGVALPAEFDQQMQPQQQPLQQPVAVGVTYQGVVPPPPSVAMGGVPPPPPRSYGGRGGRGGRGRGYHGRGGRGRFGSPGRGGRGGRNSRDARIERPY